MILILAATSANFQLTSLLIQSLSIFAKFQQTVFGMLQLGADLVNHLFFEIVFFLQIREGPKTC
jgi:hypothetical protein